MNLPPEVTKCVAFLCVREGEAEPYRWNPRGTGFFVTVSIQTDIGERNVIYFVTAKHNVARTIGRTVAIRVNDSTGVGRMVQLPANPPWQDHPDHAENPADVSVLHFPLREDVIFDLKAIPLDIFTDQERISDGRVAVGNEVFMTGLFTRHTGTAKNSPIVRTGSIAMLPNERIPTRDFGNMELYLIEARSIGGLSGSPVFALESQVRNGVAEIGTFRYSLLGLIHGHWDVPEMAIDAAEGQAEEGMVNMGIAMVAPAQKVRDILMSEAYVAQREVFIEQINAQNRTGEI